MERHGSESYFVEGEGLLGEGAGGRERVLFAATAPPFRFSRMGPSGVNRQLPEATLRRVGEAMTALGGSAAPIPAGFTYLGQFVDHDLTFDKTNVMLGENITPAQLVQARSPSLDLDAERREPLAVAQVHLAFIRSAWSTCCSSPSRARRRS